MARIAIVLAMLSGCASAQPPSIRAPAAAAEANLAAIEGHEWRAVAIDGRPVIATRRPVSLRLQGGRVNGSGGCNSYFGPYERVAEGRIRLGPFGATRMGCPSNGVEDQEIRLWRILSGTIAYRLEGGGRLILTGADGRTVRFERANTAPPMPSTGGPHLGARQPFGAWRAIDIDRSPIVPGTAVTLHPGARGAGGAEGCNHYSARVEYAGPDRIRITGVTGTRMGCEEPRLSQMRRYHMLLAQVERYWFDRDDNLVLLTGTGRMIRFQRNPAP